MNINLQYLDKPALPQNLIEEVYKSLENPNTFAVKGYKDYELFEVTQPLKDFTKSIFDFEHNTKVQRIHNTLYIHKDFNRIKAFNYIIEQGGDNVETCFYNDKFELIEQHVIEKHRWHVLNVDVFHNVRNVNRPRIALTVHVHIP